MHRFKNLLKYKLKSDFFLSQLHYIIVLDVLIQLLITITNFIFTDIYFSLY